MVVTTVRKKFLKHDLFNSYKIIVMLIVQEYEWKFCLIRRICLEKMKNFNAFCYYNVSKTFVQFWMVEGLNADYIIKDVIVLDILETSFVS